MLVVDTLNRGFGGGDENGEDMAQYVGNSERIREHFGCTTLHVHHIPKSGELTERGHGSLRGAITTSLGIKQEENGVRTLICLKQKDGEDGWTMNFALNRVVLGEDEDGEEVSTCVVEVPDAESLPRRDKGPPLSQTQRSVFNELLATLEACGIPVPHGIPEDRIGRMVGKVVHFKLWRQRWIAVAAPDKDPDTARRTFDRAVLDLQNKNLVGRWSDHAWAEYA
jgi:hypothetical protein